MQVPIAALTPPLWGHAICHVKIATAGAVSPILLWEREGKALGVPGSPETEPSGSPNREPGQHRHPCTARSQPDGVCARVVRQRPSGHERGKSASGSAQRTPHPQGAKRERLRPLRTPSHFQRAVRTAFAPAIITDRPRRRRRPGGANPRSRVCGIECGAGLPAGVTPPFKRRLGRFH